MTPLFSLRNLFVSYHSQGTDSATLSGIDLDLSPGERLALIGESGSGKSTLARTLAGLLPENARQSGEIVWPGLKAPPVAGRDIGYVFQDPGASLDPVLTVGEQIAEVAVAHLGMGWSAANRLAVELAGHVSLPEPERIVKAFPHQLSGGQKQRIAIAAAICAKPRLLIADEATSALDTIVQAGIVALIRRLTAESGMALLFITHDIALAAGLADRIAVLRQGRLVETGPASQVIHAPRAAYTQSLLAAHLGLEEGHFP